MTIIIFNNIEINIEDSDYNLIMEQGNGIVPLQYEILLKEDNITPETSSKETIIKEVIKLVKDEVKMLKMFNPIWESGNI